MEQPFLHATRGAYTESEDRSLHWYPRLIAEQILSEIEWLMVADLIELLHPLEVATKEMSASRLPTFHLGLHHFEELRQHFENVANDPVKVNYHQ